MTDKKTSLEKFRDLQISKKDLYDTLPKNTKIQESEKVCVHPENIIKLLLSYQKKEMALQNVVDWVNIVWFADWYEYDEEHVDSMASVMDQLEEADENENKLSEQNIQRYINALKHNIELD